MGNSSGSHDRGPSDVAPLAKERFDPDELALLRAAFGGDKSGSLARRDFATAFGPFLPTPGIDRLFARMCDGKSLVAWDAWVDGVALACKPTSTSEVGKANAQRLGVLWDLFGTCSAGSAHSLDERAVLALLLTCAQHCSEPGRLGHVDQLHPLVADALIAGPLSRDAWVLWASASLPQLGEVLELIMMRGVAQLKGASRLPERTSRIAEQRWLPKLVGLGGGGEAVSDQASSVLVPALVWAISLSVPQPTAGPPTDEWRLLYASNEHGLGLHQIGQHVLGYGGPTLLAVSTRSGRRWAAYIDSPWVSTDGGRFFGGDACVLYSLWPTFHAHRATQRSTNFCTFVQRVKAVLGGGGNPRSHKSGREGGDEEVLAFGGTPARYRCELREDLTTITMRSSCATFESDAARLKEAGVHDDESPQLVAVVEVWGLGGESADAALHRRRATSESNRARAGRVKRAAFGEMWKDSPDKMLLELGGHVFHSDNLGPPLS